MPHGKIGWLGDGSDFTGKNVLGNKAANNKKVVTIAKDIAKINIDGMKEGAWKDGQSYQMREKELPGNPPQISGEWSMKYVDEKLYLLVDMHRNW